MSAMASAEALLARAHPDPLPLDLEDDALGPARRLCAEALAGVSASVRTLLVVVDGSDLHLVVAVGARPVMALRLDSLICPATARRSPDRRRLRAQALRILDRPELSPYLDCGGRIVLTTNDTSAAPSTMLDGLLDRLATRRRRTR
jgi:hypothetical protein